MKIGYIAEIDLKLNPGRTERFEFREATCTRRINTRGDKVYSKMLLFPVDYEELMWNTEDARKPGIMLVREPFLLDEELREKAKAWVKWANKAKPEEYDPFCGCKMDEVSQDE